MCNVCSIQNAAKLKGKLLSCEIEMFMIHGWKI